MTPNMVRDLQLTALMPKENLRVGAHAAAIAQKVPVGAVAAALVLAVTKKNNTIKKMTGFTGHFFYCPRRKEINAPKPPIKPKPKINNPSGILLVVDASFKKVAITNGAG